MGSAATIIYVRGRGVVVDEPSLVAVDSNTGEVIAIGIEAQQMSGREARDVTVIAPLLDGVVACDSASLVATVTIGPTSLCTGTSTAWSGAATRRLKV